MDSIFELSDRERACLASLDGLAAPEPPPVGRDFDRELDPRIQRADGRLAEYFGSALALGQPPARVREMRARVDEARRVLCRLQLDQAVYAAAAGRWCAKHLLWSGQQGERVRDLHSQFQQLLYGLAGTPARRPPGLAVAAPLDLFAFAGATRPIHDIVRHGLGLAPQGAAAALALALHRQARSILGVRSQPEDFGLPVGGTDGRRRFADAVEALDRLACEDAPGWTGDRAEIQARGRVICYAGASRAQRLWALVHDRPGESESAVASASASAWLQAAEQARLPAIVFEGLGPEHARRVAVSIAAQDAWLGRPTQLVIETPAQHSISRAAPARASGGSSAPPAKPSASRWLRIGFGSRGRRAGEHEKRP